MSKARASVVVVSRHRPDDLALCLTALSRLQDVCFEIVVVADPAGVTRAASLPFADDLKIVAFDVPNISAARNLGISHASGEIVAFIDDDAVPEPGWLSELVVEFESPGVDAATGYVRGRNGISFQWRARGVDDAGRAVALGKGVVDTVSTVAAVKLEGTNMALRRQVLVEMGGFDERLHYFLDETELSLRLARAGRVTAVVPTAQVHHRMAANRVRTARRVPRDLFDIGAGWAILHGTHLAASRRARALAEMREHQRARLLRHMAAGTIEPRDVKRLLRRFDAGAKEGQGREIFSEHAPGPPLARFRQFPAPARRAQVIAGRVWSRGRLRREAVKSAARGDNVTLIELSPTALYHRVRYQPEGYWLHTGGLFGRSLRSAPILAWYRHATRVSKECMRIRAERRL
ncbi:glycosyltransferase [Sulfitobacter sp. D35]|uniref:glycosyltransferase family 2 protein n=1 Tax=Sulfitobacter sp. D35 TaxID=3083252 RepID=UPI00296FFCEF|nr:glycosyltransferase [Sulfitobacter sp. D35]MDW4498009.1 glycosyltransferase [Sulfitobacter sp. D35]